MSGNRDVSFVDTNVLVYAITGDDAARSAIAQNLVAQLMEDKTLRTSTQVLQELFVTLTRKVRPTLTPDVALRYMDRIANWPVTTLDYAVVRSAVDLSLRECFSFWDALVVIAASRSGATRLYTEDLQHGRQILGLEIVNPFREC